MPTLQIAGSPVEYLEFGSGTETVVLLHSSGGSGSQWRVLAEQLSARYRVVAPDLYGYGGTAHWPGRSRYRLASEAEIVLALLGRVGGRVHLVGHSYGGAVALHVAGFHGDRLGSLTLIEPVAFHLLKGTDVAALAEIEEVAESVARAVACGDYFAGFGRFMDYWSGAGAWATVRADRRAALAARLPKVALDFHAALNEPIRLEHFHALTVPTLLVHGTHSPRPTRRICELLGRTLPQARLKVIDGAGHMAPITHRDAVNALVIAQLEASLRHGPRRVIALDRPAHTNIASSIRAVG